MSDKTKREIERLLEEPDGSPRSDPGLRARLAATLSEGLGDPASVSSDIGAGDPATVAAYIDGRLTGAARDSFVAALAQHQNLRTDVESASELVQSISDAQVAVPKHLLARANAQFAPEPPRPQAQARASWRWDISALLPRRRMAYAMVAAALAVIVAVPAAMKFGGIGGGAEPELSSVPVEETAKPKSCDDKVKDKAKADKAKAEQKGADKSGAAAKDDPCDRPAVGGKNSR